MATTFDKKQIVSTTELVRSFKKYEQGVALHDIFIFKHNAPEAVLVAYERYEQIKQQLEELKELLEQVCISKIVEQRKNSPEEDICLEKLQKKYGL